MGRYRLLQSAADDLAVIADYTIERFGIEQARAYRDGLLRAFETIATQPFIGSDQGHIKANIRRFIHASHAIYYRVDLDEVVIFRILGPGQDPLRQLG